MRLDTSYADKFIKKADLESVKTEVIECHNMLEKGSGEGSDYLGWLHLPSRTDKKSIEEIQLAASSIRNSCQACVVIGIGGSYLGARAAIEFMDITRGVKIIFAGNNIDPDYLSNRLDELKGQDIAVNVISKSGTTLEPAAAFRVVMDEMKKRYKANELKKRVICTTTQSKGALFQIARKNGFGLFFIPENIGGRFSVLTSVGLLPMAIAGIDIDELIKGAVCAEEMSASCDLEKNPSCKYAVYRNILYRMGKKIEIGASFHQSMLYVLEWWKQLYAESEGKNGKGIVPLTAIFSTDLHANGQLIQEGERNIFETFLAIDEKSKDIALPACDDNLDGLNYLAGKGLSFINKMAYKGTSLAHMQGGVPNMTLSVKERSAFCLGQIFYFFQRAVGLSGYLLKVNPFNQPGVEAYKKNMLSLLK
ncbi:MAG: glucose-6-phosphate isomerase [Candidatus Omnitrophica bacterium]|jgi:glucose-6-phosphate isomerase|nr:glucose-6-phosphate isomerase [Candidatus Omnitrophota bacterium]